MAKQAWCDHITHLYKDRLWEFEFTNQRYWQSAIVYKEWKVCPICEVKRPDETNNTKVS